MSKLDARLRAACGRDGQQAHLEVIAGAPLEATRDDLVVWLAHQGVRFGVDEAGLEHVRQGVLEASFVDKRQIAAGRNAEKGVDGRLAWVVAVGGTASGRARDDGSIDHRARGALCVVEAGAKLADIHEPRPGRPGHLVSGQEVPAPPVQDGLPKRIGPGVERRGLALHARHAGVVFSIADEVLDVVEHIVHEGHVGMGSGDLDAPGALSITGNVEAGARVTTEASLHVGGYVEGATVVCGGDLTVKGGLLGQGDAEIVVGGSLSAGHADHVRLVCQGTLSLERSAVHTRAAAKCIHLGDGRGTWLGGEAMAETTILLGHSGSRSHEVTVLAAAQPLEGVDTPPGHMRASTRGRGRTRAARTRREANAERKARLEARKRIRERQEKLLAEAHIEVRGRVQPGTVIVLGPHREPVQRPLNRVRFRYDPEEDCIQTESL